MTADDFYHQGARTLQDQFDSRRLADRLEQTRVRAQFTDDDRAFIEGSSMFFLATADERGRPDCSYKGGRPGFVRVVSASTVAFPSYDGNGMYRSLGNVLVNPHVGLLFIDFESPKRLRVNGVASIQAQDDLLAEFEGAQVVVRVHATHVFLNCPRYIHPMKRDDYSVYVPSRGHEPPRPAWKTMDDLKDVLPARDQSPEGKKDA